MKKNLPFFLLLLLFAGGDLGINAQCTILTNPIPGPTLQCASGTTNRSSIAWNPIDSLYYSVNAGSSGYPLETFGPAGGTSLSAPSAGFDFRGAWWNPALSQFEGNGYNTSGIRNVDLASGTGYALGTGTAIFTGLNQPNAQSCGTLDYDNNEIIYYYNGAYHRYDRATNASLGSVTLTGVPVALGSIASYSSIYTGCPGNEYGLYDMTNKRVYLFDKSNGAYSQAIQLPVSTPVTSGYGVAYANDMIWIFDTSNRIWVSYQFVQTCTPPTASISLNGPASFCAGDSSLLMASTGPGLTYQWLDNGQVISGATDSMLTVNQSGAYQVIVADGACRDTSSMQSITVFANPTASLSPGGSSQICLGDSLTLSATMIPGAQYQWYEGSNMIAGATGMSYAASSAGSYYVMVTDSNGCSGLSDTTQVSANTPPAATISTPGGTTGCSGDSLQLLASPGGAGLSYQWYQGGVALSGATDSSLTVMGSGSYTVEVTDSNGCIGTSSVTSVSIFALPNPSISLLSGDTLSLPGTYVSYQWVMNGSPISGATSSTYAATMNGQYYATVTDSNGCTGNSDTLDFAVGIDPSLISGVQLYPNPGQDRFQVSINGDFYGQIQLELYDLQGRRVRTQSLQKTATQVEARMDTGDLSSGLYHLRLIAGETVLIKKWVKD